MLKEEEITKFEFLGKGTYGQVFRSTLGDVDVALKELETDKVFKDIIKLLQEIKMSILTYHPRVPKFHGVFFNKYVCLIFDLVKGKSLKEVSDERYVGNDKLKFDALVQLVSIINDLHKSNIIHRDIKPDNIIVNEENQVFLIDFGTSKVSSGSSTKTYDAKGTTLYMAPENYQLGDDDDGSEDEGEAKDKSVDEDERPITISVAFDVWSLGCIISEICSGIQPWKNYPKKKNINENLIMKFLMCKEAFPIPVTVPDYLKNLLKECFQTDPLKRIKTADLLKKLKEIRDSL
jgi:serine/threonine protein kinase